MECVGEGRLQNCTGRCAKHKRSGRCKAYLWRRNGCGQEGCGFGLLILLEAKRKDWKNTRAVSLRCGKIAKVDRKSLQSVSDIRKAGQQGMRH